MQNTVYKKHVIETHVTPGTFDGRMKVRAIVRDATTGQEWITKAHLTEGGAITAAKALVRRVTVHGG